MRRAIFRHAAGGAENITANCSHRAQVHPDSRYKQAAVRRNDAMDARSFFSAVPETLKRNQFGGALGGPIRKDRIWFYGFYEGLRQVSAFSANAYTPTQAMFNGNFQGALYAKFVHRVSAGLNFRVEYTFSKVMTDAFEGPAVATSSQIADCRACDKGFASFDQTHRLVASTIYDLPVGRGRRFGSSLPAALNAIAGGWTVTGITTFATGVPIFITSPSQTASIYVSQRPNRTCGGSDPSLAGNLRSDGLIYFNTSCFTTPAAGYFGNSGRDPLHGPGQNNWDLGLQKEFHMPVSEQSRLQFRGEFFNAFNHAQFTNPDSNTGDGAKFGRVAGTQSPRLVQIALKLLW